MPHLDVQSIRALADGRQPMPFDVLGLHALRGSDEPGRVIRAMLPWARDAWVVRGDQVLPMDCLDRAGVFELVLDDETDWFPYRIRGRGWHAEEPVEFDDPYRLSPVLDEERLVHYHQGHESRAYEMLGARRVVHEGFEGTVFSVWAPNAEAISVIASFNGWDHRTHPMRPRGQTGIWELFVPGVRGGDIYKFSIHTRQGQRLEKADPYARAMEMRPRSASVVVDERDYEWRDHEWMEQRVDRQNPDRRPISIYEVHLGSWRRNPDEEQQTWSWLGYRELAEQMLPYVAELGFTHVELMPVTEHPFDGSWGYQTLGYFAPTSRFGSPDDFRYFVDEAHRLGLGVILDWVPAHFPTDAHGLAWFDGTHLYEHADPRKGQHPDWGTLVFNYGRNEVSSFLVSSAVYWLEQFHVDGLRVDAVASMLYLDYSREAGEWIPNQYGGRENLEAIAFLKRVNEVVHHECPGVLTFAEESTAWPGVSRPADHGGLGFDLKWNMGWMNDTLDYLEHDPLFRKHMHDRLTFSLVYAFSERFLLPLSHDEVVHGKRALVTKLPGFDPDRFATLRALYGYMWTHPGKKLLFMGGEIAQWSEWNHEGSLEWHLLDEPLHRGVQHLVGRLNHLMRDEPALYQRDFSSEGFEWIDSSDADRSIIGYLRWNEDWSRAVAVVSNFTPMRWEGYQLGLPFAGGWSLRVNTADPTFGGSHAVGDEVFDTVGEPWHGRPVSIRFDLPPLSTVILTAARSER